MDKENVVYPHNGILFSHKKEILPFATIWRDLEGIMLSEISQREKDKYCMVSLIKQNKTEPRDTENRLVVARGKGLGEKVKWMKIRNT